MCEVDYDFIIAIIWIVFSIFNIYLYRPNIQK